MRQILSQLPPYYYKAIEQSCRRKTALGHPACVLLFADLLPGTDQSEAILYYAQTPSRSELIALRVEKGVYEITNMTTLRGRETYYTTDETVIDAIHRGDFTIQPAEMKALHLKDRVLIILP